MASKGERLAEFRKKLGINQRELAEAIGIKQGALSQVESDKTWMSPKNLEKLRAAYKVSLDWLITGQGSMFAGKNGTLPNAEENNKTADISGLVPNLQKPVLRKHGEMTLDYMGSGLRVLPIIIDPSNEEWCSVVPEFALASYSFGYMDMNFIRELPMETVPEDLRGRGTVRKFYVYGDSMEPNFRHGDWVYCTFVECDPKFLATKIRNNYVYAINTSRGIFLKRLFYHEGDDFIQCYSDYSDKHKPFVIHLSEVRELWYWRRTYTAHAPAPVAKQEEIINIKRDTWEMKNDLEELKEGVKKIMDKVVGNG